jgi:hypothetical protein
MIRVLHDKNGVVAVKLSEEQIPALALTGDPEAKLYIAKKEYSKASTLEEKIDAIAKAVGLL